MQFARASLLVFFWLATAVVACGSPASAEVAPNAVTAATGAADRRPLARKQTVNRATATGAAATKSSLKIDTRTVARSATATTPGKPPISPAAGNVNAGVTTAAITPNMRQNIFGPASLPGIEMGDRPARSTSLCGSSRARGFAELDVRTTAALLPEINGLQPRTICARRGVLIADYAFR